MASVVRLDELIDVVGVLTSKKQRQWGKRQTLFSSPETFYMAATGEELTKWPDQ